MKKAGLRAILKQMKIDIVEEFGHFMRIRNLALLKKLLRSAIPTESSAGKNSRKQIKGV